MSMDTNVFVPYKQTCTAGEEQQSQQCRKYEATSVTLVHDPSNEMVLLRTVLQEKIILNHSVLRHSVNSLTANEINSYFWKRSAQQVIISGLVVLEADPVANNPTQSTGGRNRIPSSSIENKDGCSYFWSVGGHFFKQIHWKNVLPAMQALTRDTQVPVIMALNTKDEMSPLLGGHMEAFWERKQFGHSSSRQV